MIIAQLPFSYRARPSALSSGRGRKQWCGFRICRTRPSRTGVAHQLDNGCHLWGRFRSIAQRTYTILRELRAGHLGRQVPHRYTVGIPCADHQTTVTVKRLLPSIKLPTIIAHLLPGKMCFSHFPPALKRPDFVTFILMLNTALDYQTFHAEPQSLLSRRDDTCERLRSLRGLRPYEESAERPSVYVEHTRSSNSQKQ